MRQLLAVAVSYDATVVCHGCGTKGLTIRVNKLDSFRTIKRRWNRFVLEFGSGEHSAHIPFISRNKWYCLRCEERIGIDYPQGVPAFWEKHRKAGTLPP